jgi:uracil-DNA glycosylase
VVADDVAGRGNPWDHDPGPAKSTGWPELFAETPNYRGLGQAVLGREAFRWHFGPMFFRGRLDGSARVVVVGQEGAQDESLAHRSFTGGTGARMQHFLRHLGIDRSYVFLNTFVYPIFGQYNDDLRPLAQDARSPIVAHRHRILDKVVSGGGDVRLMIGVGRAAKETVATWIASRGGGAADPERLHLADPPPSLAGLRFLGVLHPGGATGGATAAIKADFARAAALVAGWVAADPGWLPSDPGVARDLGAPFVYRSAPVPFRDFPFGTCPRLGRGATSSNRTDNQRGIQLFSANGAYNAAGASLDYTFTATGSPDGYADEPGDIPVEPPRGSPRRYDAGPSSTMARLLAGGQPGLGWPDFAPLGVTSDPSFGTGAVYRGRFSPISLVVLADPAGPDDVFTGRALTGEAGQRLQAFLAAAGLTSRYLVLRTLPVDTSDVSAARRDALVDRREVRAIHAEILRRVGGLSSNAALAAVVAVGRSAARLAPHVVPAGLETITMRAWGDSGARASWQAALDRLAQMTYPKDVASPSFVLPAGRGQVPAGDLPYGTPHWMGSSGDRASRPIDRTTGRRSPDYLKLYLPVWVANLASTQLTSAEQAAADLLRR